MSKIEPEIYPLGDQAIVIRWGNSIQLDRYKYVQGLAKELEHDPILGMIEYVPAYTTLTIYYDPYAVYLQSGMESENSRSPYEIMASIVITRLNKMNDVESLSKESVFIEVPVCYGGAYGPDLLEVAKYHQMSSEDVITLHTAKEYQVYMIGFMPGFPYLGGLDERIATPRKQNPRFSVPVGSVGIAGNQTGIYPMDTPGGWQIIGKTPVSLFCPEETIPSLLKAGDRVRFVAISSQAYEEWEDRV